MIVYFDASALVKKYIEETGSGVVQDLLQASLPATSRYTALEVISAVSRRCRSGDLSSAERDRIADDLDRDVEAMYIVEVVGEVISTASRLLRRHPLRAADTLQLASASVVQQKLDGSIQFISFDRRLNQAASREGLSILEDQSP